MLAAKINLHVEERAIRAVNTPTTISHLEDPAILDRVALLQLINFGAWTPGGVVPGLATVAAQWLQSIAYTIVLVSFSWWLALALFLFQVVVSQVDRREFVRTERLYSTQHQVHRRSEYVRDLALSSIAPQTGVAAPQQKAFSP
jgi:hypothetical protein